MAITLALGGVGCSDPSTVGGADTVAIEVLGGGDASEQDGVASAGDAAAYDTHGGEDAGARDAQPLADSSEAADTMAPGDASGGADGVAADGVGADASQADTASLDDTAAHEDTLAPDDASQADTSLADTGVGADVVAADTTAAEELPVADTGILSGPPYLMWVTQTEVSVRWETTAEVVGRVDYGADDSLPWTLEEESPRRTHELRLTGLEPGAAQSYRVVYGGGALPVRHFRTAPPDDDPRPLRFVVWGDNQNGPDVLSTLVPWMGDFDPDFALSVGDTVQNGTRAEYRSQLFEPLAGFADEVPFLVAAGNHERYQDSSASLFEEYFSQPGDEHCFGWRYGGLFVLFVDTDLDLDGATTGQRACVEAALSSEAAVTARIRAAAFHKPPRVEWWAGGLLAFTNAMKAPWVRADLEPLLESYGVDIVFNGHNHLYAHTPETAGGITWVTTGGAGGSIDTDFFLWRVATWPEITTTIHEHHFLRATLDDDTLVVEAVDVDGAVLHSFTVVGGP
ncbi:MAG: hypothetical protein CVU56_23930 [Deltaproteobacteria bacterium HGW-Deltaproteobacteria-14]|nr:MAG: hypothetical protein CVU56_23930 [Deltaproteobacteria bacterium HGW-Deltaproteobacteria-14]